MVISRSRKNDIFFLSSQKSFEILAGKMDAVQREKALNALKKTDSKTLNLILICLQDLREERLLSQPDDQATDPAETIPLILSKYVQLKD